MGACVGKSKKKSNSKKKINKDDLKKPSDKTLSKTIYKSTKFNHNLLQHINKITFIDSK